MSNDPVSLKWSAQFTVSPSPRAQGLPGDKIILPPSALEQLLAASTTPTSASAIQRRTFDSFNPYEDAAFRQSESQFVDRQQQLPQPLTFRLVNPINERVVYAGIREFSAEDGELVLSHFLQHALGLEEQSLVSKAEDGTNGEDSGMSDVKSCQITVHARQLAKGTYVKLRPLEAGYDPEDWKALLEQHLRANFTTLTNGEVLVVPGGRGVGRKNEEFRFLIDGFQPEADGICIVDTDLEVDIEALNEEQARETLTRIAAKMQKAPGTAQGSSSGGDLDIFTELEGQIVPGEYVDYQLPSWPRTQAIEFELKGATDDDDVDLLVSPFSARQRARPRVEGHIFADWGGRPSKRIRLEPTNVELEDAEALWVSVHAYSPVLDSESPHDSENRGQETVRHFSIRARVAEVENGTDAAASPAQTPRNPDEIRCKNCNQWVPQRTLFLHENFCLRNNVLCPQGCGQVFQKRSEALSVHWHCQYDTFFGNTLLSRQKHQSLYHPEEPLHCTECSTTQTFSSVPLLAQHHTSVCSAKTILCRFCHLEVPQEGDPDVPNPEALLSGLTSHELADGSRTTECHLCNKITRLRDMDTHLKHHDLQRKSRPRPRLCRNVNCGRTLDGVNHSGDTRAGTRMGQGPGNDVGLCSTCYGPLYVSMYDPEGKAMRRRIERKYLQQLLSGCGKGWCRNEYCKTGRKNARLPDIGTTTKDALPLVKPFVDASTAVTDSPLHFCTDEGGQRKKEKAKMLAAEYEQQMGKMGYDLVWCVGALEAEGGDLEKARTWLSNWAPRKDEEKIS